MFQKIWIFPKLRNSCLFRQSCCLEKINIWEEDQPVRASVACSLLTTIQLTWDGSWIARDVLRYRAGKGGFSFWNKVIMFLNRTQPKCILQISLHFSLLSAELWHSLTNLVLSFLYLHILIHGIMESYNHLSWKGPLKVIWSNSPVMKFNEIRLLSYSWTSLSNMFLL